MKLNVIMMTCSSCKHWGKPYWDDFRECLCPKLLSGSSSAGDPLGKDGAKYGGYEGYGDYFRTGSDFGCIHWQNEEEE